MADTKYFWPKQGTTAVLGKEVDRIDGLAKATGAAKYTYDVNLPEMLIARALGCPHGHAKVTSIDTAPAESKPGVHKVYALKKPGDEIMWQGDLVAAVVADSEGAAVEALAAIKIEYETLDVFTQEEDLEAATKAGRVKPAGGKVALAAEPGDDVEDEKAWQQQEVERLLAGCAAVVEGYYGIHAITHMCLEPHGSTCTWADNKLTAYLSTQNVTGTPPQFAQELGVPASNVEVVCEYIGGGFGSKFAADAWGTLCGQMARDVKRPVKLMLTRDQELKDAGNRPSAFAKVKVGADSEGVVQIWDSEHWGTGGFSGGGVSHNVVPYVFEPPNLRRNSLQIATNTDRSRAWRAPNHPQACALTATAYDDVAAKLGLDSYDVFLRNLKHISNDKAEVYAAEMEIGAKLIDWKAKWHPHGKGPAQGSIVSGLGMALHTWGGGGHNSTCLVKIHPDGGVEAFLGSQDLGTGTRTVIAVILAETFGLPIEAVKVNIGRSSYPPSGPSGGSTTVGGVSESTRRASQDAWAKIAELAAAKLGVAADQLEATGGRVQVTGDAAKSLSWKEACSLLGMMPLEVKASFNPGRENPLSSSGVGGIQMAEVQVDRETGVVRMKKFVAVQDMGTIISRRTAKSQIYGAAIMGIAYSLFEERIMDPVSGAFLNAELADYKLARIGDIGEIIIELYEPQSEYQRGVIGLGEPPVISPGAAISNAVANALGVRVPVLPLTPQRVLGALAKARS